MKISSIPLIQVELRHFGSLLQGASSWPPWNFNGIYIERLLTGAEFWLVMVRSFFFFSLDSLYNFSLEFLVCLSLPFRKSLFHDARKRSVPANIRDNFLIAKSSKDPALLISQELLNTLPSLIQWWHTHFILLGPLWPFCSVSYWKTILLPNAKYYCAWRLNSYCFVLFLILTWKYCSGISSRTCSGSTSIWQ